MPLLNENGIAGFFIKMEDAPFDRLDLVTIPEISNDSGNAQYQVTDIFRHTEPVRYWQHTTPRQISFTTKFFATFNAKLEVLDKINWCRALMFPLETQNSSSRNRPPIVILSLGSYAVMRCVIPQVSVSPNMGVLDENGIPLEATVSFLCEQTKRNEFFSKGTQEPSQIVADRWFDIVSGV